MRQGMIQIYCGDGKGKTTAATGLAVRAAGSGMKVLFARFLKNENSAELCVLDQIPGIEVIHLPKSYGFYNTQSEEEKQSLLESIRELDKVHKSIPCKNPMDANFRRLQYVRFLLSRILISLSLRYSTLTARLFPRSNRFLNSAIYLSNWSR